MFPLLGVYILIRKIKFKLSSYKVALFPLIANAVLLSSASFSYNFGIDRGLTSVVAPVAASYPTLFVVLAFLVFKDPITRQQILGIVTTLIGIVLLSIFSV